MNSRFRGLIPARIRERLGANSNVALLNGRDVFSAMRNEKLIIMGCNARIRHVIPGIMQAAEELDAVVAFELTRTEGGLDGGYTGQTPESFADAVIESAERFKFTRPFLLHGDHITIKDNSPEELDHALKLLAAQIAAGFTSFAIDASFNSLQDNIRIVKALAEPIMAEGYGIEAELRNRKTVAGETELTSVTEAEEFLSGLAACGVAPLLLSINNGSKSGNYLDGQKINIDLIRTMEVFTAAQPYGVAGIVQNGITGTPSQIVGKLADFGVRKGNIGTLWQNIAHAGLPLDLMDAMRKWSRKNKTDIKYATGVFRDDIDSIPEENVQMIHEMAYREAKELLTAFRAKGSATRLVEILEEDGCA